MPGIPSNPRGGFGIAAVVLVAALGCDIRDEAPRPSRTQALAGAEIAAADRAASLIEYLGGYEAGRQRAAKEGKPLLLVCTAAWCRFSADLTRRALRDSRVVAVSRRTVCVLLDADRDAEVCGAFGVRAFPTLLVLDPAGAERLRVTGRSTPEAIVTALEEAVESHRLATAAGAGSGPL